MKTSTFLVLSCLVCVTVAGLAMAFPVKVAAADCTPNFSKQCISNIVYSYNACGALESVYQNCNLTNQTCQNGQCVTVNNGGNPSNHATTSCYNNDLYWYNSQGVLQEMSQSCKDNNSCTLDSCTGTACTNQLTCDGSTCATTSQDYITYCSSNNQNQTPANNQQTGSVVVSLFAKKESDNGQWSKNIDGQQNDVINFLVVVKNISTTAVQNVSVKTDITNNISYTGNLKINDTVAAGNVILGVSLGTLNPKTSVAVSFTGLVQPQNNQGPVQIVASANSDTTTHDSDQISLTTPAQIESEVTPPINTGNPIISNFAKNWFIWLIIVIVLITVFIIIFRKLSTNV